MGAYSMSVYAALPADGVSAKVAGQSGLPWSDLTDKERKVLAHQLGTRRAGIARRCGWSYSKKLKMRRQHRRLGDSWLRQQPKVVQEWIALGLEQYRLQVC